MGFPIICYFDTVTKFMVYLIKFRSTVKIENRIIIRVKSA